MEKKVSDVKPNNRDFLLGNVYVCCNYVYVKSTININIQKHGKQLPKTKI